MSRLKFRPYFPRLIPLAFEHCVGILTQRLSELYRTADSYKYARNDGTRDQ